MAIQWVWDSLIMANLTLYYGTMETGKTTKLIQDHYNYSKYLLKVILLKPKVDTKGGDTVITRIGENIKCDILIPKSASLLSKKYFILISFQILLNVHLYNHSCILQNNKGYKLQYKKLYCLLSLLPQFLFVSFI